MAETLETMDPESVAYARLVKADIDRYVERRCAPLLARIDALERAAAIAPTVGPAGKDGRDGVDGKDGMAGRDGPTGLVGPAGEKGADGIPGERGTDGAAGEPGSQGPAGPAGEKGEPGERGESGPKGEPGERGPAGGPGEKGLPGEPGLDGRDGIEGPPGRDAARLEIGEGIEARRVYRSGSYVTHLGGLWRSLRMTDPIEEGATPEKILAAGWNVLVNGLADMAVFDDGERTVKFALMSTDGRTQVLTKTVPGIVYRNLFIRGEQYKSGDVVTWDGSAWIAGGDTKAEPGTSPDWKLFVRKGRDRGKLGE